MNKLRSLTNSETEVRLVNHIRPVVRFKAVFIAIVVLCCLGAYGISRLQTRTYDATALLLFRDTVTSPAFLGQNQSVQVDPTQAAATDLRMTNLPRIARLVAARVPGLSAREVEAETTVAPQGQSNVVGITVADASAARAAQLATLYAQQAIAVRREADQASLLQTLRLVQASFDRLSAADRATPYGRQLQSEANQLSILASLQTGQAELIQQAQVPNSPASFGTAVYLFLGLLVGSALAYGVVTLLDRLDRRIHTVEELTRVSDRPAMGFVPRGLQPGRDRDVFNVIRTSLRYVPERPVRSVLITSTQAEEGKTTVAWNLASAAATAGTDTLLIEADLRRPSLAETRGLNPDSGLSDVLAGFVPWQDAVVSTRAAGTERNVDILLAGTVPANPTDLLASNAMARLLAEAVDHYALVVIDSAPLGLVPDAVPVAAIADATLVVCRLKRVRRDHLSALLVRLESIGVRILGLVANYCERPSGYGYGYGYGYASDREPDGPRSPIGLEAAARTRSEDALDVRRS